MAFGRIRMALAMRRSIIAIICGMCAVAAGSMSGAKSPSTPSIAMSSR
jgi:hypothetical protein